MTTLTDRATSGRGPWARAMNTVAFCSFALCASNAAFAHGDRAPPALILPSVGQPTPPTMGLVTVVSLATPAAPLPNGSTGGIHEDLTEAMAALATDGQKVEIGIVADEAPRVVFVSIGESKQTFWRFAPPDQPEGWFDDTGRRLGGPVLAEPKPRSRISSQFGPRRYYGRISSGGFHNGIDYEGRMGEPIYAAADGIINHSGWYFEYGRTVKISHADRFVTLYAHLSHFAEGIGPGVKVRRGELIGHVGMTGRSTGPHLHFSTIVDGQFVDPAPYMSAARHRHLLPETLVLFREWQDAIRAATASEPGPRRFRNPQSGDEWTTRI
jgi:murein DD-endopeptidase MepM/ murein hydrolase activator NlpD